jgi:conjugal transfer pilus assembly protein TraW
MWLCSAAALAMPVFAQQLDSELMNTIRQHKAQADAARANNAQGPLVDLLKQQQGRANGAEGAKEAVTAMGMAPQSAPNGNPAGDQVKDAAVIVFISLGMPNDELRYLLSEGAGKKDVVFLLRGTFNNDMKDTMDRLMQIADPKDAAQVPNLFILPQAFANYRIDAVPVVFGKEKKDWFQVNGAPSIGMAMKEIRAGRANHTIGRLWPVAEEDIAQRMKAAMEGYDWRRWQNGLAIDMKDKLEAGHQLPYSLSDESYYVDLSVTFPSDIKDKDGRVAVKAGTRFNPLEKAQVPGGAIMVIDPADARQRSMAKIWLKKWPAGILMVTRYDEAGIRELGVKVIMVDALAVSRFQLHSVPSLLTADRQQLLVRTYAPRVEGGIQ